MKVSKTGMSELSTLLEGTPYAGYAYAYPHKTAYRPLTPQISLRQLWQGEDRSALFLYLHVPFCEMRCETYARTRSRSPFSRTIFSAGS